MIIVPPAAGPRLGVSRESTGVAAALVTWNAASPGAEKRRPSSETRRSTVCDQRRLSTASALGEAHASSDDETKEAAVGPSAEKAHTI